jgi:hypothetical protein
MSSGSRRRRKSRSSDGSGAPALLVLFSRAEAQDLIEGFLGERLPEHPFEGLDLLVGSPEFRQALRAKTEDVDVVLSFHVREPSERCLSVAEFEIPRHHIPTLHVIQPTTRESRRLLVETWVPEGDGNLRRGATRRESLPVVLLATGTRPTSPFEVFLRQGPELHLGKQDCGIR